MLCKEMFGWEGLRDRQGVAEDSVEGKSPFEFLEKPKSVCSGGHAAALRVELVESQGAGFLGVKTFIGWPLRAVSG
jgi:hypothetical protein